MNTNNELPAELQEQIDREALQRYPVQLHSVQHSKPADLREYERQLWTDGATEWAIWKVRYDELKKENERLRDIAKLLADVVRYVQETGSDHQLGADSVDVALTELKNYQTSNGKEVDK